VVVLVAALAAVGVAVLAGVILGYEVAGHVRRLRRAASSAADDLRPRLATLVPPATEGRHRAP
jgi:uncharacterized protein with ACT and thioredoxin-like domain